MCALIEFGRCVWFAGTRFLFLNLRSSVGFVFSERLKFGLLTETKAWRLAYGKSCNNKYRSEMEAIFDFIDDMTKRLNRPIKDLDDIRYVMAALKEIRENEIKIDMLISPIEVFCSRHHTKLRVN